MPKTGSSVQYTMGVNTVNLLSSRHDGFVGNRKNKLWGLVQDYEK